MSERHPMPSGNWIELRDWRDLRRGDKKRALSAVSDIDRVISAGYEMADGLLTLLVTNWSYELPLPSASPQSLELLPLEDDAAVMEIVQPVIRALFPPKADPADGAQQSDPASPTAPSVG
ncbi:hypothetical protein OG689_11035 [Kitasatospora sp. NBC_00240]|uniref:hypothetical protein n=1 Tax=Kitasatospora sp. NBC_00240 TaxID=2903567 RepID=UPI0022583179|nr:hypothetical protein [Kitasatospora sp. NBC_00240]MCX5209819.1 hypothetical protein [Kitasatospora sp. NBC_00240]